MRNHTKGEDMTNDYIDRIEVNGKVYELYDPEARRLAGESRGAVEALRQDFDNMPAIPDAYEKDESDGRYASKADLLTKVGYAEVANGMLNLYADRKKERLIATVILPTGDGTGGGLTEAQARAIIQSYGYTTNTGTYSKPSTGIPESDLSQDVKNKLNSTGEVIRQGVEEYFRDNPIEGVTPEMIGAAVEQYLEENPVGENYDHTVMETALQGIDGPPANDITTGSATTLATTMAVVEYVKKNAASGGLRYDFEMNGNSLIVRDSEDGVQSVQMPNTNLGNVYIGSEPPTDGSQFWLNPEEDVTAFDRNQYYTPEAFGAKGDGVTDDTDALNACLLRAHYDKRVVLLRPATYLISNTIYVRKTTVLRGTSIEKTVIKNVNDNVYAIEMRSFHPEVHELTVESKLGIHVGGKDTSDLVAQQGYMGNRCLESLVRRVWINDCKVGINCEYEGGYNRFELVKVSPQIHKNDAVGFLIGQNNGTGAGVNYIYLNSCTCEPVYEEGYLHKKEEGTTGIKICNVQYMFINQCDIVGFEKGIDISDGTVAHVNVEQTTIFNNEYAIWASVNGGKIDNISLVDSIISGTGYYLCTEDTTTSRTYGCISFRNVSCPNISANDSTKGFYCYKLRKAIFDGYAMGSTKSVKREFFDCTFAKYQEISSQITETSSTNTKTNTVTVGNKLSLAPIKVPSIQNIGTGDLKINSFTDNGDGTMTVEYSWQGGNVNAYVS